MKNVFLLLLLTLMTGCEAKYEEQDCLEGWVEFACKYPKPIGKGRIAYPKRTDIKGTQKDAWVTKGGVSLYYDTRRKKLNVTVTQVKSKGAGKCQSAQPTAELDLVVDKDSCQRSFIQTAYTTVKAVITCNYAENKYKYDVKFFCKDDEIICEDILSTKSSSKSSERFSLTDTSSGFNITITSVSSHDAGVYWCGVETNDGRYRVGLSKIKLDVIVPTPPPTFPVSSTQSAISTSAEVVGGSQVIITVTVCVAVLLFVLMLIAIYKQCSHSENTGSAAAAQPIREDYIYEEIQETVQKPDSAYTVNNTIYSTVSSPPDPSASLHYCTIKFKSSSEQTGGEAPTVKSRSACEYSTVKYSQPQATYATVNPPSRSSQELLHSKVNKPQ